MNTMFPLLCSRCVRNTSTLLQSSTRPGLWVAFINFSTTVYPKPNLDKNHAWVRQTAGPRLDLKEWMLPHISSPSDVLIRVNAASVNPMDVAMLERYGEGILDVYGKAKTLIGQGPAALCNVPNMMLEKTATGVLGRDFSGVVEDVGHHVVKFKRGDEVYGATDPTVEGSHAQYTLVSQDCISMKPINLSHIEAAALPYAALTFLSAVNIYTKAKGSISKKRVLVNAAAGGVGSFALQYLKAKDCEVTAVVSAAGYDIVKRLNADHIVDYKSEGYTDELHKLAGFDVVFDLVGDETPLSYIKPGGWYLTAVSPLLQSSDDKGVFCGTLYASSILASKVTQALYNHGVYYSWAFFIPNSPALEEIKELVENNKIQPIIDEVVPFEKMVEAFEKVGKKKGKGKVIIDVGSYSVHSID